MPSMESMRLADAPAEANIDDESLDSFSGFIAVEDQGFADFKEHLAGEKAGIKPGRSSEPRPPLFKSSLIIAPRSSPWKMNLGAAHQKGRPPLVLPFCTRPSILSSFTVIEDL